MRKVIISCCMLLSLTFFAADMVRADSVTYELNVGSTLPSIDYGSVTLTTNGSGGIVVSVDLSASGAKIIKTGMEASFAFNMLDPDTAITIPDLPGTYSLVSANPGALNMDGFGNFEYGIVFDEKKGLAASTLMFTVNRSGGFTNVAQLVELSTVPPGDKKSFFSVDVIKGGSTGVIGAGMTPIPEPISMFLFGSGLIGMAAVVRRRFKRQS